MVVLRNTAVTKHELQHKAQAMELHCFARFPLRQVDRFKDVGTLPDMLGFVRKWLSKEWTRC